MKSDIERLSKTPVPPAITEKCQGAKDIPSSRAEVPPVNDSSITKLEKVLESQFSRENEGLSNKNREEDKRRKNGKEK